MASRGYRCRVVIQSAYGQPRCHLVVDSEHTTTEDLSPRLPKKDLKLWLEAFLDGLTFEPPSQWHCDPELEWELESARMAEEEEEEFND